MEMRLIKLKKEEENHEFSTETTFHFPNFLRRH